MRGIQRMVEEGRDCEAIVTQLMAARAALDRAGVFIMTHHIESCLLNSEDGTPPDTLNRVVEFFFRFTGSPPISQEADTDLEMSEQ